MSAFVLWFAAGMIGSLLCDVWARPYHRPMSMRVWTVMLGPMGLITGIMLIVIG